MCGIGGFYGDGDNETLERMAGTLARRGPDDHGTLHHGTIGLAQTRLSIIDLSHAGHQPMTSTSKKTSIVFNGEIYNFQALKKEIRDYTFHSNTDTEVILALYEKYGEGAFAKLSGMFAFALHDHHTGSLYLVRDRMGKKPLYYGLFNGALIFGSELKALMQHSSFKKEIDPEAVSMYLTYECVPTPYSIFKNVRKVEAGGYVAYSREGKLQEKKYWTLPRKDLGLSFDDALHALDEKLDKAVESRLVADVPLGVFLSGGIDSSTIAYYASRVQGSQLKTFSIGFSDADFDESHYAKTVAERLGVDHTMEYFSSDQCRELIPKVYEYLDEPIADASALPTYLLSAFTRKHVTVALGGDGADELFAGYPTFQAEKLLSAYLMVPQFMRQRLIEPLIRSLPVRHSYFSLDFRLKKFLEGVHAPAAYRHQHWLAAFNETESQSLLSDAMRSSVHESPYQHLDQFFRTGVSRPEFLNDVLWSYLRTYCMDEVLAKVDRMSMAHGLEVRAPFLDTDVVELAMNLPYNYKFRGLHGKHILKSLMRGRLPNEIIRRRKQGFAVPIGKWLQKELRPLSHEVLSSASIEKSGVFNYESVSRLLSEHEAGLADHRKKLWTLMAFQLWFSKWGQ